MKVLNIHSRTIHQPMKKVAELLGTLSSEGDQVWPKEKWPKMSLDKGLKVGSKGGHGPIRYSISKIAPGALIVFEFSRPKGFDGIHQFELTELENDKTELKHTIKMRTSGTGTLAWRFAIRWLHDALVEDAFDKVENHFSPEKKKTEWGIWVKILWRVLQPA